MAVVPERADQVLMLTGAGISVDAPSCIPPGLGLTTRALEEAAGLSTKEIGEIGRWFRACGMPGGFPRFETVIGAVSDTTGESGLRSVLRDLLDLTPNDLHTFFAQHLAAGGTHITANIDAGIERADESPRRSEVLGHLIHFHGVAEDHADLRSLGITLSNVESGFPDVMLTELQTALRDPRIAAIVVVGYSGTDYFDMSPFLASLQVDVALRGTHVLWFDFDPTEPTLRVEEDALLASTAQTIELLRQAGATVTVVRGSVRRGLAALARRWGLSADRLEQPSERCRTVPSRPLSPADQFEVRLALFGRLGYLPGLPIENSIDGSRGADVLAAANWNRGRYDVAAQQWSTCFGDHPDRDLLRAERVVACNWVSGRYVRALIGLRRLISAVEREGAAVSTRAVVADTGVRLWEHMRQMPDIRWLASGRFQARLSTVLPTPDELDVAAAPPDLLDRITVARMKIRPTSVTTTEVAEFFARAQARTGESSSLVRTLNYRQGELRERKLPRTGEERSRQSTDLRRLWQLWRDLGAEGEVARLLTAPGAVEALGLHLVIHHLLRSSVDYPLYHRARLVVLVLLSYVVPIRRVSRTRWRRAF